ncbi:carboxymuconolactone decarboxylase family protein [Actinoplanes sp. NPDC051851]|uniref:carboxymuconolactone decarboxylase family protein n=1 Tax=Actinoplanes sp. NPDC051851 TaxID=3154753 RepID=UPI003436B26A
MSDEPADRRQIGLRTMDAVYGPGFSARMPPSKDPFLTETVEQLFANVWSRPLLSIRDRRLLVLGATAALGRADLIEVQARGALANDELTPEQLNEAVIQLAYYVGWGNATALKGGIDAAIAKTALYANPPQPVDQADA